MKVGSTWGPYNVLHDFNLLYYFSLSQIFVVVSLSAHLVRGRLSESAFSDRTGGLTDRQTDR